MKNKIVNGVEAILLLISFVILNIPCITMLVITKLGSAYEITLSVMEMIWDSPFLAIILVALFLLCFILCIISIFSRVEHRDSIIHNILSIILFLYVNYCITVCGSEYAKVMSNKFPTGILEFCLFAVIVISFIKRLAIISGLPEVKVVGNATSNAEELKKYKDLLDGGAITQEEFDEKKKQLLGL